VTVAVAHYNKAPCVALLLQQWRDFIDYGGHVPSEVEEEKVPRYRRALIDVQVEEHFKRFFYFKRSNISHRCLLSRRPPREDDDDTALGLVLVVLSTTISSLRVASLSSSSETTSFFFFLPAAAAAAAAAFA